MNHRNDLRLPLILEVELWHDKHKYGSYKSSDVSCGGIFIEGCHNKLAGGEFVTTNIKVASKEPGRSNSVESFLMKALVVRTSARGVGLMWATDNEPFFRLLDQAAHTAARTV